MASDGLNKKAKTGTCRMCLRRRCTEKHVKPVADVFHGFAVGHIWECIDHEDCDKAAQEKLDKGQSIGVVTHDAIVEAKKKGRWTEYKYFN